MGRSIADPTADYVIRHESHDSPRRFCVLCDRRRPTVATSPTQVRHRISTGDLKAAGWRIVSMRSAAPGCFTVDIVRGGERRRAHGVAWS